MHVASSHSDVLGALQGLSEAALTTQYILPLLAQLGYRRVDYHGGPYESGADIYCERTDELNETVLIACQVKKLVVSASASKSTSFAGLMSQLRVASHKKVPSLEGVARSPNSVWFITPFPIDVRSLESWLEEDELLATRRVRVIDGVKLAELLRVHMPTVYAMLRGIDAPILEAFQADLSHHELMLALHRAEGRPLPHIYADLDLMVGRMRTRLLFAGHLVGSLTTHELTLTGLSALMALSDHVQRDLHFDLLVSDNTSINEEFASLKRRTEARDSLLERAGKATATLSTAVAAIRVAAREAGDALSPTVLEYIDVINQRIAKSKWYDELDSNGLFDCALSRSLEGSSASLGNSYFRAIIQAVRTAAETCRQAEAARAQDAPTSSIQINGLELARAIRESRDLFEASARQPDIRDGPPEKVRPVLEALHRLCEVFRPIFDNRLVLESLGLARAALSADSRRYRMPLTLSAVLDSGTNVIVLGEAGSGKTTSLMMHAQRHRGKGMSVFIPLARLVEQEGQERRPPVGAGSFEQYLARYYQKKAPNIQWTVDKLARVFNEGGFALLLDGLDEAVTGDISISDCILDFAKRYPNVQVVVSSRPQIPAVDDLPFVCVTLLPLAEVQVGHFVDSWFGADAHKRKVVHEHLKSHAHLRDIVRTPLLITVLCVLADFGVSLPGSEVRLYHERMRLLLGEFDRSKGVRRMRSDNQLMHSVAKKLAFELHASGRRSATLPEMLKLSQGCEGPLGARDAVQTAVLELADPCNVLVPMDSSGAVGFGHLRYQEYLSAEELRQERTIDIVRFMDKAWWRDSLVMWATLTRNLEEFVEQVTREDHTSDFNSTLAAMIRARPAHEQGVFVRMVESRQQADLLRMLK
jgi:hypothetical protein